VSNDQHFIQFYQLELHGVPKIVHVRSIRTRPLSWPRTGALPGTDHRGTGSGKGSGNCPRQKVRNNWTTKSAKFILLTCWSEGSSMERIINRGKVIQSTLTLSLLGL